MAKTHNIYNQVSLFSGPSPSSGYNQISNNGYLNTGVPSSENYNLIFPIERAISTSFEFNPQRTIVRELGVQGILSRPILEPVDISLNFSYYLMGLINEARLGFSLNVPSGHSNTGKFLYGSSRVCPISGMISRDFDRSNESLLYWPLKSRDSRNIYAISKKDLLDANDNNFSPLTKNNSQFYTTAFGDCYLDSYETSCAIGQLPQANVKYTCNNVMVYDGTSGQYTPSILTRNHTLNSGIKFYIPNSFEGTGNPTVILPQNISVTINQTGGVVNNLLNDFNDIKLQSYAINFQLQREPLRNLGYKYPMDRVINLPALVNISFDAIAGDSKSSSLIDLFKQDNDYNFTIKLNYQSNTRNFSGTAIQYDFIGAKFDSLNDSVSISNKRMNTYNFSVEMKPDDTSNGFFISGYLGIPTRTGAITYLSGQGGSGYILDTNGNLIQTSTAEFIPLY